MTVKELKAKLAEYPEDMEVSIYRDATEDYDEGAVIVESVFYDSDCKSLIID